MDAFCEAGNPASAAYTKCSRPSAEGNGPTSVYFLILNVRKETLRGFGGHTSECSECSGVVSSVITRPGARLNTRSS